MGAKLQDWSRDLKHKPVSEAEILVQPLGFAQVQSQALGWAAGKDTLSKCVVSPAAMYSHALCIIMAIHPPQGDIFKILWNGTYRWFKWFFKDDFGSAWLYVELCFTGLTSVQPVTHWVRKPIIQMFSSSQVLTQIWLLIQWTSPGIETREKSEWAQHVFFYLLSLRIEQNFFNHLGHSGKSKEDHQLGEHIPKLEITWKIEMY